MNIIRKILNKLIIPKGFYELNIEFSQTILLEDSLIKYIRLANICQRYKNGYLIAMSYGNKGDIEFNYNMAQLYDKLYNEYREEINKYK